ncbi:MAG: hypothetical protein V4471_07475, partial [Pseudomonadota bacterium]
EKSLAQLLRQLKEAKIEEAKWGPHARPGNFEILNDGIKALENIQFASVDGFASVKELMEIEQYFLKSDTLRCFHFPDYKSHINPELLMYVEMEVQLDTLELKANDLAWRGYKLAANEAKSVVYDLRYLNILFFKIKKMEYEVYKDLALKLINNSRPVLEKHRGCKQIFGNLIVFILTAGMAFPVNKAIRGHFLFFKQTDSAKQLEALSQTINTYSLQQSY